MMLKVLDVDGAVRRVRAAGTRPARRGSTTRERYRRVAEAREREQQAMLDYLDTDRCRMGFLRDQLDDPAGRGLRALRQLRRPATCRRRCPRRRWRRPAPGSPAPACVLEPRKLWPTALANLGVELRGKIGDGAGEGRAVARLTDLGHGQALRDLFRPGRPDGPVPVPLVRAVIEVLGDWRPSVEGIVVVESATRATLTADLAEGLSRYLRVPVLGRWAIVDPGVEPGQGAMNSAQRVAAVGRRFRLESDPLEGRSVLLVDDLVVTGWTMTLAARAVRAAGATAALPLALGTQS